MSDLLETGGGTQATTAEEEHADHAKHPNYVGIAIVLAIITAIEVAIPQFLDLEKTVMVTSLLILMVLKGAGVALYYMHLRYDSNIFSSLFAWPLIIAAAMILVFMAIFHPVVIPG